MLVFALFVSEEIAGGLALQRHAALVLFVTICSALALEAAHYLPLVPDPLASHFDFSGRPDGWSSHFEMIAILILLVLLFVAIFSSTFFLESVPDRFINLPNKTYWLAPERREATLLYVSGWLRWFLVLTLALLTLVFGLAFRANLSAPPQLSGAVIWMLLFYLAAAAAMVVALVVRLQGPA
jgi:serine/threonine-protein kinase